MQQILFHLPFTSGFRPPDGLPIFGFGAMLFITFFSVTFWGGRRSAKVGLPRDRLQDMAIVLFLSGIAGARLLYMFQYSEQFPDRSPLGLVIAFFEIWNGGIVFYGSVFTGVVAYLIFRRSVIKRLGVNDWQLADAVAPMLAFGMALGRIGCYLNGCCWGQVVCEECQPVPLVASLGQFPLLAAHARSQVTTVDESRMLLPFIHGLQTSTGFSLTPLDTLNAADPRSVVAGVEPGSEAERAGIKPGDRIIEVNGEANLIVLEIGGTKSDLDAAEALLDGGPGKQLETAILKDGSNLTTYGFTRSADEKIARTKLLPLSTKVTLRSYDRLWDTVQNWPRGKSELELTLERGTEQLTCRYVPRTVTFFPTQLYETLSMLLLTFVILAYQPFRRHHGQLIVVLMLGYAIHRFLNESIRIEPTYALGLTLSQWISIAIFLSGLSLELYLRLSQTRLPKGPVPLGFGAEPVPKT